MQLVCQDTITRSNEPSRRGAKPDHPSIRPKRRRWVEASLGDVPTNRLQVMASRVLHPKREIEDKLINV